jgi:hypothetical protein
MRPFKFELLLPILLLVSCNQVNNRSIETERKNYLQSFVRSSKLIELPFNYNINEYVVDSDLLIDRRSSDSLIFGLNHYSIIGLIADSSYFYGILYNAPNIDNLRNLGLLTLNKDGIKIDDKIICIGACTECDCDSFYQYTEIEKDLRITMYSYHKSFTCDDLGRKVENNESALVIKRKGVILGTGKIQLDKEIMENE